MIWMATIVSEKIGPMVEGGEVVHLGNAPSV